MQKKRLDALQRVSVEEFKQQTKTPIVLVLDNIRSGLNVGSAFRTADAFALEEVVLCGITAQPPHKEILKTAIGATASVAWTHYATTVEALEKYKAAGYRIMAVEQVEGSIDLEAVTLDTRPIVLILGNEVKGVSEEALAYCESCIEIPQFGTKHSFNVSVCLGIVSWELFRKMRRDGRAG